MPCMTSDGMGQSYSGGVYDHEARRKLDHLTRVSCEIMQALEAAGMNFGAFSQETQDWWASHKAEDARKAAAAQAQAQRDELRTVGLSKLSAEERKALGL